MSYLLAVVYGHHAMGQQREEEEVDEEEEEVEEEEEEVDEEVEEEVEGDGSTVSSIRATSHWRGSSRRKLRRV